MCNPYCGPCAKAHTILEELVNQEKINLQVILRQVQIKKIIKQSLFVIFWQLMKGDKKKTQNALDNWHKAENKDDDLFAAKYPMNGEMNHQDKKIEAM